MSQYSADLMPWTGSRPPFREWEIATPTTRRLSVDVGQYRDPEKPGDGRTIIAKADAKRLTLTDTGGDNFVDIVASSRAEFFAIQGSPGHKKRGEGWTANRPRYGTWAWYAAEVALLHYIFDFAGWTATPEEAQVIDALEEYGKRAPARYLTAA
jgi:hypothetical protein